METIIGPCLCGKPERVEDRGGEQVMIRCPNYIKIRGKNPQGTNELEHWGCAISWMPILTLELIQVTRGLSAAIEDFRNQMIVQNDKIIEEYKEQLNHEEPRVDLLTGR